MKSCYVRVIKWFFISLIFLTIFYDPIGLDMDAFPYTVLADSLGGAGEGEVAARAVRGLLEKYEGKDRLGGKDGVEETKEEDSEIEMIPIIDSVDEEKGGVKKDSQTSSSSKQMKGPQTAIKLRREKEKEAAEKILKEKEEQEKTVKVEEENSTYVPVQVRNKKSEEIKEAAIIEDKKDGGKNEISEVDNKRHDENLTMVGGDENENTKNNENSQKKKKNLRQRSVQIPEKSSAVLALLTAAEQQAVREVESSSSSTVIEREREKEKKEKENKKNKETTEKEKEKEKDKENDEKYNKQIEKEKQKQKQEKNKEIEIQQEKAAFQTEKAIFESKISSLQKMLEKQSNSVSELRDLTKSLRAGTYVRTYGMYSLTLTRTLTLANPNYHT